MELHYRASKLFSGARQKLQRATTHLSHLSDEIERFRGRAPYRVFVDRQPPYNHLSCEIRELIPASWGCLIGNAVHNMRCALDLLANDLVAVNGEVPGHASFPITHDDVTWRKRRSDVQGMSETHKEMIREVQPFVSGDNTLLEMHHLDIVDKHRLLVAAASALYLDNFAARQDTTGGTISVGGNQIPTAELGVHRLGLSWHDAMSMSDNYQSNVSLDIILDQPSSAERVSVIPALQRFLDTTSAVVDRFDRRPHLYTV